MYMTQIVLCFQLVRPIVFCAGFQNSLMMKGFRVLKPWAVNGGKVLMNKRGESERGEKYRWGVRRANLMDLLWIGFCW